MMANISQQTSPDEIPSPLTDPIIKHVNHAETHSNTRRIRMFYVNCLQQVVIIYSILYICVPLFFF